MIIIIIIIIIMASSTDGAAYTTPRDENFDLVLRGRGSRLSVMYREPIIIPERTHVGYIGLKSFSFYNNVCNIVQGENSKLIIFVPASAAAGGGGGDNDEEEENVHNAEEEEPPIKHTISLETGAYEIAQINNAIQTWIVQKYPKLAKTVKEDFALIGNRATQRCEFHIRKDGYGVSFNVEGSVHKLLGYNKSDEFKSRGRYIAPSIADICPVTAILFNTNISASNYFNGVESPFIYVTPLSVPPGYRLFNQVESISYKRLTTSSISYITCWLTDQLNRDVDILSDELVVVLSVKLERIINRVEAVQPHHRT